MKLQIDKFDASIGSDRKRRKSDCAVRAISKCTGLDYDKVYDYLWMSQGKRPCGGTRMSAIAKMMDDLGWTRIDVKKTFNAKHVPMGNVLCIITRHAVAVQDHVVYDTYDSVRSGRRKLETIFIKQ